MTSPRADSADSTATAAPHWASLGESTFVAGIQALFWVYRRLGRLPFRLCLYPVVSYYWVTRAVARRASLEYLSRLQSAQGSLGHVPDRRDSLRHLLAFADAILDKLVALNGGLAHGALRVEGEQGLLALTAQGKGAVIVTGHVGCMELCRISAERHQGLRLNVLVHTRHAERFNRLLQRLHPDSQVRFIQVTDVNPATAMLLADKVAQGELVAIAGDRVPVRQSTTVAADFLGHSAQWPVGPYVLAALLKCPLYAMGCVREPDDASGRGSYVLRVQCLAEQVVLPRGRRHEAMAAHAQDFAHWLESLLARAPLAWFNFFPFWAQGDALSSHDPTHHASSR